MWGPKQSGKTTLLKETLPHAFRVDLLKTDEYMRYNREPAILRREAMALPPGQPIVIDEVQKIPALLDEVHFLIQEQGPFRPFYLCGSSARKVKQGHANLLGGRAIRLELFGLCMLEIASDFNLLKILNNGTLPSHYKSENPKLKIRSYIETYLKEEVLHEGLVRNLPIFSDFLRVAAIGDTEVVNLSNIARECGVSGVTVREHYAILVDTLLGAFVPAYVKQQKRRTLQAPKFYLRDVGIVNHLSKRGQIVEGSRDFGKAFENFIFHEISCHSHYSQLWYDISYWRLSSGAEVDFVLGDGEIAIAVKAKQHIQSDDYKGLKEFKVEHPNVKKLIIVCLVPNKQRLENGIELYPYKEFIEELWAGQMIL